MKLKISNCDETQKTQSVMKLKNLNCEEIQIVMKLKV
jgi:hypothetical protein